MKGTRTMTTKERLKRLESYSVCDNYREKEEDFREIEKALEVLEILHDVFEYKKVQTFMDNLKSGDEFFKIKEWYENAK